MNDVAQLSRRGFFRHSAAAAATLPFFQHLAVDYCDASPQEVSVDFSMGYVSGDVRLNRNENPFGPSPKAIAAIQEGLVESHRYVQPHQLQAAIAARLDVDDNMVGLGCGSSELLFALPHVVLADGGNMISTLQTYRKTPDRAQLIGAEVKWIPFKADWSYDVDGMLEAVDKNTRLLYLVSPNNPTGAILDFDQLKTVADNLPGDVLCFIDEAYHDFLPEDRRGGLDLLKTGYRNVYVTRTFSKVHGLAGLRIGYGVGDPETVRRVTPFTLENSSMNTAGFGGALAALDDREHIKKFTEHVKKCRTFFEQELSARGLQYVVGHAPFVLVEVGQDSKTFVDKMATYHVHVRKGEDWGMPRHVRISYGSDEENRKAVVALATLLVG